MNASRRWAIWPRLVAVSLIGLGAASCSSNSGRFSDVFSSNSSSRTETTGSIPQTSPSSHIQSQPLPRLAGADPGMSGGGRGMGSYEPNGETTGSVPAAPPPPTWTWEGGTPIVVAPGETLESISRRHGVPVAAIMQANNIVNPTAVHPGEHLVIPRLRSSTPRTELGDAAGRPGRFTAYRASPNRRRSRGGAGRDTSQHLQTLRQTGDGTCQGQ